MAASGEPHELARLDVHRPSPHIQAPQPHPTQVNRGYAMPSVRAPPVLSGVQVHLGGIDDLLSDLRRTDDKLSSGDVDRVLEHAARCVSRLLTRNTDVLPAPVCHLTSTQSTSHPRQPCRRCVAHARSHCLGHSLTRPVNGSLAARLVVHVMG